MTTVHSFVRAFVHINRLLAVCCCLMLSLLASPLCGCSITNDSCGSDPDSVCLVSSDFCMADCLLDSYVPYLEGKRVSLVVNQASLVNGVHLCDTLLSSGVNVVSIMAPEHGFRGDADAGEETTDGVDPKTGLPVISLYGKNKKPTDAQLANVDVVIYDLQDVGVRFYTYISTLHYVMQACADNNKTLIVLDRPNPNGDYIDGPVLEMSCQSFVGVDPIPVVYGLTPGELAAMINGERWLTGGVHCDLKVVTMKGYSHSMPYEVPVPPSPNLRNAHAIRLYPSLCFFEATNVSVGRGTDYPFEVVGAPDGHWGDFTFIPKISFGAKSPLHQDKVCTGVDLRHVADSSSISLDLFVRFKSMMGDRFWSNPKFFDLLAGTKTLRKQIDAGLSADSIKASWKGALDSFKARRQKYLLYDRPDYEVKPIVWSDYMHRSWVDSLFNSMTIDERIAQLLWITLDGNPSEAAIQKVCDIVEKHSVGGVLLMQMSLNDVVPIVERISASSRYPLLFAVDGENGLAMKMSDVIVYPKNDVLGCVSDMSLLEQFGHEVGRQLKACGVNVNFAPVVDANTNPSNPIIGKRSFGSDSRLVAQCGVAVMRGMQAEGCLAVAKHFPGHGDTSTDSHLALPLVDHDRLRLDSVELLPFREMVDNGVMGVMSAHLIVPAFDSTGAAASMSYPMLTDLLRNEMRFEGLVVSDAMNMQGAIMAAKGMTQELLAVSAGNDVAEFCTDVPRAILSLHNALDNGALSPDLFETKVRRVLAAKLWCNLDKPRVVFGDPAVITNSIQAEMLLKQIKASAAVQMTR